MGKNNKIDWDNPNEKKKYQKEYSKDYNEKNKDEIKERNKEYYKDNKEKVKKIHKNYRKNNIERVRLNRSKDQKNYIKKYPEKVKAHIEANNKIKISKGQLCEICNKEKAIHKHHPDYSKPLEVIFVCIKCHNDLHNEVNK